MGLLQPQPKGGEAGTEGPSGRSGKFAALWSQASHHADSTERKGLDLPSQERPVGLQLWPLGYPRPRLCGVTGDLG